MYCVYVIDINDIVLINKRADQLQQLIYAVVNCAEGIHLEINVEKTKYMKIGSAEEI